MILFSFLMANTVLISCLLGMTIAFYALLKRVDNCKTPDRDLPFISVVIPARNEEMKIARCLESMLAQDYPAFELVVIDDRSTDKTAEIIESFALKDSRVKFVRGKDAPDGWVGKCNALAYAVGFASGDWYVFTDADTCHEPNSLRDAIGYAVTNKVDLVSFVPLQELGSLFERVVMTVLLSSFLLGDPFHTVNDPLAKRAYAYGQYIICRRRSYLALGGHQSVRDTIVEDHALGRVFKEKGYKIAVADGKTLYRVRMYLDLESMWQGWTKNLYSLIDSSPIHLICVLISLNLAVVMPAVNILMVGSQWVNHPADHFTPFSTMLVACQFLMMIFWFRLTAEHRSGVSPLYFLMLPFGALSVTLLHIHSAYLVLFGREVSWKGRRYTVNSAKTIRSSQTGQENRENVLSSNSGE